MQRCAQHARKKPRVECERGRDGGGGDGGWGGGGGGEGGGEGGGGEGGTCHSTWKEAFTPVAVLETARTPSEPTYQKAAPFHDLQPRVRGDMSMRAKPERC